MKNKSKKYNFIIYTSLIIALVCIIVSGSSYLKNDTTSYSLTEELKEVVKETDTEEELTIDTATSTPDLDEKTLIENKLKNIVDGTDKDELLTENITKTWEEYSIENISYLREIAPSYYAYQIDIKISNLDAVIPVNKNEELSTDEYLVFTLNFNITYSQRDNGYIVKLIEIPNTSS